MIDEGLQHIEDLAQLLADMHETSDNLTRLLHHGSKLVQSAQEQLNKCTKPVITFELWDQSYWFSLKDIYAVKENGVKIGTIQKLEIPYAYALEVIIGNKRCCTRYHEVTDIFDSKALLQDLVQLFDGEFHIDISYMLPQ